TFGLSGIAQYLETGSWLFWRGRRTAPPRHRTIAASIDWSYDQLSEAEQAVLRNLSVFKGAFNLDAACEIARRGLPDHSHDLHIIDKLVAKSLLSFDVGEDTSGYRLRNTARVYALEKQRQHGEFQPIAAKAREPAL